MSLTRLSFFGGFRIFDQSNAEREFPIAKGVALIAYLVLSPWGRTARGDLTGLLWSEQSETAARTALRQCLYQMKSVLKNLDEGMVSITSDSISIDRQRIQCDTDPLFLTNPREISFPHFHSDNLLRGLEGLDPAYDEWLRFIRDECDRKLRAILRGIMQEDHTLKRQKLRAANWMHELDPSDEKAARFLIEDAARRGDQVELLKVYKVLWNALDEGWDEEPSTDLQEFVGEARASFGGASSDSQEIRRKFLTVLSFRLSMGEGAFIEPEEISKTRKSVMVEARRIIDEHDGFILHASEEGLRAAFGLPSARETDVRNCIEASIALQDSCKDNMHISGGIGLDAGVLIVEGSTQNETLNIVGLPLDQAIFLSNQSNSFEILATEHSVRRLHRNYVTKNLQLTTQNSTSVVSIICRETTPGVIENSEARNEFVGRDSFLSSLEKIWTSVSQSSSLRVVNIQGPAGIGKTRLVDEFLRRLSVKGVRTAIAICDRYDRSAPLDPVFALIASLGESTESGMAQTLSFTSPPSHVDLRAASEMSSRLTAATDGRPTVIFLDDWQWADDATRMTLNRYSAAHHGSALLIVLTSRESFYEDQLMAISHQIILPNFTLQEVEAKAALLLDRPLERRIKEEIYSRSGGNPLLLEEICHALSEPKARWLNTRTPDTLPANIQSLIASRIERLDPEDIEIVYAAAVHGVQLDPEMLSIVVGRDVPESTFQRLCASDIFTFGGGSGAPRFKHGIAMEVTYSMIPLEERRRLHLIYAELLLAKSSPDEEIAISEVLALHYSGGGNRERAFYYSEISGDKALAASALDQAMWHYGTALELMANNSSVADIRRWVSIAMRWAIPCVYAASHDHLPILLRSEMLANEAGDKKTACQARYWIGFLHFVLGDHEQAIESLQTAETIAHELNDAPVLAEVQAIHGCALGALARYNEAQEIMSVAVSAKARNPSKTKRVPVTSLYTRAHFSLIRADRGDFEGADKLIAESFRIIEGIEHEVECTILNCAAVTQIWRGNWNTALDQATRARELSEKVSSTYLMGFARSVWGYAHWRVHGGEEGLNMLFRASSYMEEQGMALYISLIHGWLAEAFAESGNYTDAREACSSAMKRSKMGEIIGAAMAYRAVALCDLKEGQLAASAKQLRMAEEVAELRNSPHERGANHLFAAQLRLAEGRHEDVSAELNRARAICEPLGLTFRLDAADELENVLKRKG